MIDQINKLIAINLYLLFVAENEFLYLREFKDHQGNQLAGAKMLADMMQEKELIKPNEIREFCYELTETGKQISKNGGWLKHLERQKVIKTHSVAPELKIPENTIRKISLELIIAGIIIAITCFLIVSLVS